MLLQVLSLIVLITRAASQTAECNPLGDMSGCGSLERCREVFVESRLGERISRINSTCYRMLEIAENRSRDAKKEAAMANKDLWKRINEIYGQVCDFKKNVSAMWQDAEWMLQAELPESKASSCRSVLDHSAIIYDTAAHSFMGCFRNHTLDLMMSAQNLEDKLTEGTMDRIDSTARILEDCVPDVESCDIPHDEVEEMFECVVRQETEKSLVEREKELQVFTTQLLTYAGANYTILVQRMHRCFTSHIEQFINQTDAVLDLHSHCTGQPRVKDEL